MTALEASALVRLQRADPLTRALARPSVAARAIELGDVVCAATPSIAPG